MPLLKAKKFAVTCYQFIDTWWYLVVPGVLVSLLIAYAVAVQTLRESEAGVVRTAADGQPWEACVSPVLRQFSASGLAQASAREGEFGSRYVLAVKYRKSSENFFYECHVNKSGEFLVGRRLDG